MKLNDMKHATKNVKLNTYFETLNHLDLLSIQKRYNLEYYLDNYLFRDIIISGKRVLEIGAGAGMYSFYMACLGAEYVVSLEPEVDGSTSGIIQQYHTLSRELDMSKQTQFEPTTLQLYEPDGMQFDIILLYNTVNHLNEDACTTLHMVQSSRSIYYEYFQKIYNLLEWGGTVIIADCSRRNFFSKLSVKNPFAPTIEWEKHQPPEVWVSLLEQVGFSKSVIRWRGGRAYGLRRVGVALLANRICSYFLDSHFCLTMHKVK